MGYFKDAEEVYEHLGGLFRRLADDPELGSKLRRADTVVRYEHTEPDAVITVRVKEGEPAEIDFGASGMEPEVTMAMPADVAHRFWLGEVNVAVALARGQIRAEGPVDKLLRIVPLARPAFPLYREQLIAEGRADLAQA